MLTKRERATGQLDLFAWASSLINKKRGKRPRSTLNQEK